MASNTAKIREWSTRFERFRQSAKTVSRFYSDERVSIQAFYYWRDKVQANSRTLQAHTRNAQTLTAGSAIGKAITTGQQIVDSDAACIRMIIRIGAISVECHAESASSLIRICLLAVVDRRVQRIFLACGQH